MGENVELNMKPLTRLQSRGVILATDAVEVPEIYRTDLGCSVWFEVRNRDDRLGVYPISEKGTVNNYSSRVEDLKSVEMAKKIAREAGKDWESWSWGAYSESRRLR